MQPNNNPLSYEPLLKDLQNELFKICNEFNTKKLSKLDDGNQLVLVSLKLYLKLSFKADLYLSDEEHTYITTKGTIDIPGNIKLSDLLSRIETCQGMVAKEKSRFYTTLANFIDPLLNTPKFHKSLIIQICSDYHKIIQEQAAAKAQLDISKQIEETVTTKVAEAEAVWSQKLEAVTQETVSLSSEKSRLESQLQETIAQAAEKVTQTQTEWSQKLEAATQETESLLSEKSNLESELTKVVTQATQTVTQAHTDWSKKLEAISQEAAIKIAQAQTDWSKKLEAADTVNASLLKMNASLLLEKSTLECELQEKKDQHNETLTELEILKAELNDTKTKLNESQAQLFNQSKINLNNGASNATEPPPFPKVPPADGAAKAKFGINTPLTEGQKLAQSWLGTKRFSFVMRLKTLITEQKVTEIDSPTVYALLKDLYFKKTPAKTIFEKYAKNLSSLSQGLQKIILDGTKLSILDDERFVNRKNDDQEPIQINKLIQDGTLPPIEPISTPSPYVGMTNQI